MTSRRFASIVLPGTAALLLLAAAFILEPDWTRADEAPSPPLSTPQRTERTLGSLESVRYLVEFLPGDDGEPRYTVRDRADGTVLAAALTAEEVEASFPDLPLGRLRFTAESRQLMLAEPEEH